MTTVPALRLDDVGAASKLHEVYGVTRVGLGPWRMPFPGNWLFLKYVPPIKRWAPYRELSAADWESILRVVDRRASTVTVAVTAAWVERDGTLVPYPKKFPAAARVLREGVRRGVVEIANHGYTHCVLDSRRYLPRLFSGNRRYHREFYAWVPEATHREHLRRSRSEEHTSELQSQSNLVCRLLLEKKKNTARTLSDPGSQYALRPYAQGYTRRSRGHAFIRPRRPCDQGAPLTRAPYPRDTSRRPRD